MADTALPTSAPARRWLPVPRAIGDRFSAQLDLIRWVAAFLVCITHLRSLVIVDHEPGAPTGWGARAFYSIHGFGHEAVMVFFILSGYLVGGEILRQWQRGEFAWRGYAMRRLTRLYPVYLAALALGGGLDHLGLRLFPETGLYTRAIDSPMIFYDASSRLGMDTLLGNLFFCQEILVPTFGSNVPLWSLTNEAWYYVIFPLGAALVFGAGAPGRRGVEFILLAAAVWFVRGPVLLYLGIWLLGLVPHFLRQPIFRRALPLLLLLVTCMTLVRLRLLPGLPVIVWHFTIGVLLVLLLNTLEHGVGAPPAGARWHRSFAGFSYSLYLLHWPVGVFLCGLVAHYFHRGLREELNASSLLLYAGLLITVYVVAWLVALGTEHRTGTLRAWLAGTTRRTTNSS